MAGLVPAMTIKGVTPGQVNSAELGSYFARMFVISRSWVRARIR